MSTVSRGLPPQPHLDVPKREARALLDAWRQAQPDALARIENQHPQYRAAAPATIAAADFKLADAQLVLAREYGSATWAELKQRIESHALADTLHRLIRADDRPAVVKLLQTAPHLLHLPVKSGNWGPPLSHAANFGHLEMIQAISALGARDHQHAFDRAILQGRIECARWLLANGAKLAPGLVMGPCETLDPDGLRFLAEVKAPFTDAKGSRLAPLALALGTYARRPETKREILEILATQIGLELPRTPIMAFHLGRVDWLAEMLDRDPTLLARRFSRREIFPLELGCRDDDSGGMCGTPVAGTTLLHLAIDYDERPIFDLLLARGADVNARAAADADGCNNHTPLFNAVVNCAYTNGRQRDAAMVRDLLARGASPTLRASLRKFLDWRETPGWHEARDVTPAEWARDFPERNWVNVEALRLIDEAH